MVAAAVVVMEVRAAADFLAYALHRRRLQPAVARLEVAARTSKLRVQAVGARSRTTRYPGRIACGGNASYAMSSDTAWTPPFPRLRSYTWAKDRVVCLSATLDNLSPPWMQPIVRCNLRRISCVAFEYCTRSHGTAISPATVHCHFDVR